ncbi:MULTISPECIES: Nif3-like dinuclear metal center hexameric protein [Paenibacillus]|uniref:GTP cyclohydrolase 1 type 2 homolog n=1 Tax=Paenibacillus albilobatus TaxID=2716884 RepID=A0A919XKT3_9BACL|nr:MULTISPECIES: Nif3-like dinuclear metal center hexameric protein [Paenibacillus]GIO34549.1 hypothetical protein J2TS6_56900 [Paenibacillus albilobatus]
MNITVQDVIDQLPAAGRLESTVDRLATGTGQAAVRGIAVSFIASYEAIREAASLGANLFISHEGVFYRHQEGGKGAGGHSRVQQVKERFIESAGMTIYRYHDHPHMASPDLITRGLLRALDWERHEHKYVGAAAVVTLPEARRGCDIAFHVKSRLHLPYLRAAGSLESACQTIGIAVGYRGGGEIAIPLYEKEHVDLLLAGEGPEWETPEYVRDAAAQGCGRSFLLLGHAASEAPGMKLLSEMIEERFPGIPVHFINTPTPLQIM